MLIDWLFIQLGWLETITPDMVENHIGAIIVWVIIVLVFTLTSLDEATSKQDFIKVLPKAVFAIAYGVLFGIWAYVILFFAALGYVFAWTVNKFRSLP